MVQGEGRQGRDPIFILEACSVGQAEGGCGRDPRNVGTLESRHWPCRRMPGVIKTSYLSQLDGIPRTAGQGRSWQLLAWMLWIGGRRSRQRIFTVKRQGSCLQAGPIMVAVLTEGCCGRKAEELQD